MDRSFLLPLVGILALVCAGTAPVPQGGGGGLPPGPKPDCVWIGEVTCGLANDECLEHDPVKCETGSLGDPDGDGCGCWILGS